MNRMLPQQCHVRVPTPKYFILLCVMILWTVILFNPIVFTKIASAKGNSKLPSTPLVEEFALVGQIGGIVEEVVVNGNRAYIEQGQRIVIVDITEPTKPAFVGETPPHFQGISDVKVRDMLAYIADNNGFHVWDISDSKHPVQISTYQTGLFATSIALSDQIAYVSSSIGLHILDISNPQQIAELSVYSLPNWSNDLAVDMNRAYIVDMNSLYIIDISNSGSPSELATVTDAFVNASGVSIAGGILYVADHYEGLHIFDVSNPTQPLKLNQLTDQGDVHQVSIHGENAFIPNGEMGLRVLDISNPQNPSQVGILDTPGDAIDVFIDGSTAYIGDKDGGLRIANVASPLSMAEIGSYNSIVSAERVFVTNNTAYATENRHLYIIDVSDMSTPLLLGEFEGDRYISDVFATGDLVYILQYDKLRILDMSFPASPAELGYLELSGFADDFFVWGDIAYVISRDGKLTIVSLKELTSPELLSVYESQGVSAEGIFVVNGIAYITFYQYQNDQQNGLRLLDISDPVSPSELGFLPLNGAGNVFVVDNIAYIEADDVHAIDVSNPNNPQQLGYHKFDKITYDIFMAGHIAYVTNCKSPIYIFAPCYLTSVDFSNPTQPVELTEQNLPGDEQSVFAIGSEIYVATSEQGVLLSQYQGTTDPRPAIYFNNPTYAVNEADASIDISLALTAPSARSITIDYITSGGSAQTVDDYSELNGTLTFAPGATTQIMTIPIVDDDIHETNETFHVLVSNPRDAVLSLPLSASISIVDNDLEPIPTATLAPTIVPTETPRPISTDSPFPSATSTAIQTPIKTSTPSTPVQTPISTSTPPPEGSPQYETFFPIMKK